VLATAFVLRDVPARALDLSQPRDVPDAALSDDPARALVCAACSITVSHPSQRIEVQGRHEHTFANPAGFIYRIGCLATACGARPFGAPWEEHTWFSGYAWQWAMCAGCGEHLGWRFTSSGSSFWGLIVDRLREIGPPRA
jgi:hypothetical protein